MVAVAAATASQATGARSAAGIQCQAAPNVPSTTTIAAGTSRVVRRA
jgi:hypothetical protein